MPIKLQIRRGTASAWSSASPSPTLLAGEIGLESDTGNVKVGTGALTWANLGYLSSTLPQVSGAGTDFNAAAYRVQGRYEISTAVTTNQPSGWTGGSDAPAILTVFSTANGHLVQVLTSVTTQKSFVRGYNGSAYTTWTPLANFTDSVNTASIVDLAVTTGKINDLAVTTAKIADDAVTDAKIRNSAALSVIGRSANSVGDPADIAAGSDGHVLRRSGTTLGFGLVDTANLANAAVTKDKIVMPQLVATTYFSGSGNFVVPAKVTSIRVTAVGGGGGGASDNTATGSGGPGGSVTLIYSVTPGASYAYVVGSGGAGAPSGSSNVNGTAGSATTFLNMTAGGGGGEDSNGLSGAEGTVTVGTAPTGTSIQAEYRHGLVQRPSTIRTRGSGTSGVAATFGGTFVPGSPGQCSGGNGATGANAAAGGVNGMLVIEYIDMV